MITPRQALSWTLFFSALALLNGCLGMPAQVQPVKDFDLDRYLDQWYEIARLDHSFARNLGGMALGAANSHFFV